MNKLWERGEVQFPRLLAEIRAIGLTAEQYKQLGESMDLERELIDELLERAEAQWQKNKKKYCPITKRGSRGR